MKRTDIEHLATLARIEFSDAELTVLETELSSIVSYVSTVCAIAADDVTSEPQVGVVHNVFRKDVVTNEPEQYTADIMAEMPHTDGRFLAVQKILNPDN